MNEYISRDYRSTMGGNRFKSVTVIYREIDLWVGINEFPVAEKTFKAHIYSEIKMHYNIIASYIKNRPEFGTSYQPIKFDKQAPPQIKKMIKAGREADVGPMACVAGLIAERVGQKLLTDYHLDEVIVENGGDIFLKIQKPALIRIFAGESPLSNKLSLEIEAEPQPLGICTSSASVGHSKSFGKADAVVIVGASTSLADGLATRYCNQVKKTADIKSILDQCRKNKKIQTAAVILDNSFGVVGKHKVKVVP